MFADLKPARAPAAEPAQPAPAQAQSAVGRALNARPAVVAQARLAQALSVQRAVVQRYHTAPGFAGKVSENGYYATGDDLTSMYALPGHDVARSNKTGATLAIDGTDYDTWVPAFKVIEDCVAAAEELMHGQKLKYGAPKVSVFRDNGKFFGERDDWNRSRGRATNRGTGADPGVGEAFVILRQGTDVNRERPQFHGAAVVARDGGDYITLEATAPLVGVPSSDRVTPIYDMYGNDPLSGQTFQQTYEGEYGADATVSVLAPAAGVDAEKFEDDQTTTTVSQFVTQRRDASLDDELPQAMPVQRAANATGMPDGLKAGIESMSGLSMDGVRVHYDSSQPAALQAHAFAQGSDIHVAPGQERHLPHEAWHVVQQAQGRVQPTTQLQGTAVNDDPSLEAEADAMGARALTAGANTAAVTQTVAFDDETVQRWPWSSTTTRYVNDNTLRLIQQAQTAINAARVTLPYAGNITSDIDATGGESSARLTVSRDVLTNIFGNAEDRGGLGRDAYNRAAAASCTHGGACNEFSALTHAALTTQGYTTDPIIRVWDPYAHHSFTMIGDPRATPARDIAVADAWVPNAQAATLADTRWDREIGAGHLITATETPLLSNLEAQQNNLDYLAAINAATASALPIYDVNTGANVTAALDDPRGGRGAESYQNYLARVRTQRGFAFSNQWSTSDENAYNYYSSDLHPMNVALTYAGDFWRNLTGRNQGPLLPI